MKLIVCLDDRGGVLFNNRRVSSDKEVVKHILELTANASVVCGEYSVDLFPEGTVQVREDLTSVPSETTYYFLEGQDPSPIAEQVDELVVYRWNRVYPSDYRFPMELFDMGLRKVSQGQFQGNSHERITWEVYKS